VISWYLFLFFFVKNFIIFNGLERTFYYFRWLEKTVKNFVKNCQNFKNIISIEHILLFCYFWQLFCWPAKIIKYYFRRVFPIGGFSWPPKKPYFWHLFFWQPNVAKNKVYFLWFLPSKVAQILVVLVSSSLCKLSSLSSLSYWIFCHARIWSGTQVA
jgi:hypothetical protein